MHAIRAARAFGAVDALSVVRDPLLRWVLALPVLVALVSPWVLPGFLAQLGASLETDLAAYYAPLVGVELLLFAPALAGMVVGFLLLDQKDDRTLDALRVSPLPLAWYLAYRLALPVAMSVLLTLITFPLAGLNDLGIGTLVVAVSAAPLAPMMALVLGTLATNKVHGFALVKGLGVVLPIPLIAYFVDAPWTVLLGVVPTYWPAQVYWSFLNGGSNAAPYFLIGLTYQALLVAVLLRRFSQAAGRSSD